MKSIRQIFAALKAWLGITRQAPEPPAHHEFPPLPPKRQRTRHSQREFRHRE